jgi:hypothetical protein
LLAGTGTTVFELKVALSGACQKPWWQCIFIEDNAVRQFKNETVPIGVSKISAIWADRYFLKTIPYDGNDYEILQVAGCTKVGEILNFLNRGFDTGDSMFHDLSFDHVEAKIEFDMEIKDLWPMAAPHNSSGPWEVNLIDADDPGPSLHLKYPDHSTVQLIWEDEFSSEEEDEGAVPDSDMGALYLKVVFPECDEVWILKVCATTKAGEVLSFMNKFMKEKYEGGCDSHADDLNFTTSGRCIEPALDAVIADICEMFPRNSMNTPWDVCLGPETYDIENADDDYPDHTSIELIYFGNESSSLWGNESSASS